MVYILLLSDFFQFFYLIYHKLVSMHVYSDILTVVSNFLLLYTELNILIDKSFP